MESSEGEPTLEQRNAVKYFPLQFCLFFVHCLHCRRLVLLRLGTLPSSPHRSHRRPLVVQSQLSSQPVGSYHSVACLLGQVPTMLERSLFALSMPVVRPCPCVWL